MISDSATTTTTTVIDADKIYATHPIAYKIIATVIVDMCIIQ